MPSKRSSSFFGLLRFFYYFISFYFQKGLQTSVVKANRPPLTTTHKKKSKKKGKKKERIEQVNRLPSFNPIKLTKKKNGGTPIEKRGFYREGCKRTKKRKKKKKKKERYFIAAPPSPSGGDKITKGETKRERRHKTQYVDKIGYRLDRTNSSVEEDLIAKKKVEIHRFRFLPNSSLKKINALKALKLKKKNAEQNSVKCFVQGRKTKKKGEKPVKRVYQSRGVVKTPRYRVIFLVRG